MYRLYRHDNVHKYILNIVYIIMCMIYNTMCRSVKPDLLNSFYISQPFKLDAEDDE